MLCVVALAGSALLRPGAGTAHADGSAIGIDMRPTDSTGPSSANPLDSCVQVQAGDSFDADLVIANANQLVQWEVYVDYDPAIVSLDSADFNYFLAENSGQVYKSEFEEDGASRKFLTAVEPHSPDSGSGTLARLHLIALKDGVSPLTMKTSPVYYGPRLVSAGGVAFGDTNGDGIWDGQISNGSVSVGQACPSATPVPTPAPGDNRSPTPGHTGGPTPTLRPDGSTPEPAQTDGTAPSGPSGGGTGVSAGTSTPLGYVANGPGQGSSSTSPAPAERANATAKPGDTGQSESSSGGSSLPVIAILAGLAGAALLAGGVFVFIRRPWTR